MSLPQYAQQNVLLGLAYGAPSVAEPPEVASQWDSIESTETYTLKSLAEAAGRRKAAELTDRGFPTTFLGTRPVMRLDALCDDGFGNKTVIPGDVRWAYLISA